MSGKRLVHLKVEFIISGYASNLVGTFGTNYTTSSFFSQTAVLTALTYNLKMIQDLRESWKPFNQQIFATPAVPKTSVNTDIQIISVKSETGLAIKHTVGEKTSVPQHGYWEFLKPGTRFVTHILAKEENLLPHIRKTFWIGKKLTRAILYVFYLYLNRKYNITPTTIFLITLLRQRKNYKIRKVSY